MSPSDAVEEQRVIAEQVAYYRARAPEYDDWFFRRGDYDHGADWNRRWRREVGAVQRHVAFNDRLKCDVVLIESLLDRLVEGALDAIDSPPLLSHNRVVYDRPHRLLLGNTERDLRIGQERGARLSVVGVQR